MYDLKSLYTSNSRIRKTLPGLLKSKFIKKNSSFEDHHEQHEYRKDEDEIRDT